MTGPNRLPELPDVPTVAEAGFGNVEVRQQWIGAFAVAGTPPAIIRKLETAFRQALADPAVRDKLKTVAYTPDGRPGEEFRKLIDDDIKGYRGSCQSRRPEIQLAAAVELGTPSDCMQFWPAGCRRDRCSVV